MTGFAPDVYQECEFCAGKDLYISHLELELQALKQRYGRLVEICRDRFNILHRSIASLHKVNEAMVPRDLHEARIASLRKPFDESKAVQYWKDQYNQEAAGATAAEQRVAKWMLEQFGTSEEATIHWLRTGENPPCGRW